MDAAAARAEKAAAKRLGAEWLAKFKQDAMEKEDMLDIETGSLGCMQDRDG